MSNVQGHLITVDGTEYEPTLDNVRSLKDAGTRFWLDLEGLGTDEGQTLLHDTFGFHPLAVEDSEHFGQRPKLDTYEGYTLLVVYGAAPTALVEVHCFFSEQYLVTIHHDPCTDLTRLVDFWHQRAATVAHPDHVMLLYRILDALIDGYFPVLATMDDQIDELEDQILQRPTDEQLGRLFDLKRSLIALRKVVTPQRDLFAALLTNDDALPGMTPDAERYFRDLYDHLIRISDLVDSYRDLISGALDTHLATVSNRLNVVMKQLTVIATIFLPMSFLTGFFGQNFGWMVNRLGGGGVFFGAGIGLQLVVAAALFYLFRRRGWLTQDGTVPSVSPSARLSIPLARRWHVLPTGNGDDDRDRAAIAS